MRDTNAATESRNQSKVSIGGPRNSSGFTPSDFYGNNASAAALDSGMNKAW